MIAAVIEAARGRFGALRLRTGNPEAARVYEAIGFRPSGRAADYTHIMELVSRLAVQRIENEAPGDSGEAASLSVAH